MPTGVYVRKPHWTNQTSFKKGIVFSEEFKERMRESWTTKRKTEMSNRLKGKTPWNKGISYTAIQNEKHWNWSGEDPTYRAIHKWIENKLGKPDTCEFCGKGNLKGHQIHWASKSRSYLRDLTDWIRLCVACHKNYDAINFQGA